MWLSSLLQYQVFSMKSALGILLVLAAMAMIGFSTPVESAGGQGQGKGVTSGSTGSSTGYNGVGTTGTTGATTTGGPPWQTMCRFERVEEWCSQTSYANVSGSTQTNNSMHVARAIVQVGGAPTVSGSVTVGSTNCPLYLYNYGYQVGVVSPGQEGVPLSNANPVGWNGPGGSGTPYAASVPTSSSGSSAGVEVGLQAYGEVPVQIAVTGPLTHPSTLRTRSVRSTSRRQARTTISTG
jgi:hypothetical protein